MLTSMQLLDEVALNQEYVSLRRWGISTQPLRSGAFAHGEAVLFIIETYCEFHANPQGESLLWQPWGPKDLNPWGPGNIDVWEYCSRVGICGILPWLALYC